MVEPEATKMKPEVPEISGVMEEVVKTKLGQTGFIWATSGFILLRFRSIRPTRFQSL